MIHLTSRSIVWPIDLRMTSENIIWKDFTLEGSAGSALSQWTRKYSQTLKRHEPWQRELGSNTHISSSLPVELQYASSCLPLELYAPAGQATHAVEEDAPVEVDQKSQDQPIILTGVWALMRIADLAMGPGLLQHDTCWIHTNAVRQLHPNASASTHQSKYNMTQLHKGCKPRHLRKRNEL